jgi:hypothetical protein
MLALLLGMSGARAEEAACRIEASGLQIAVRSQADDGLWGPTLEIEIADALQPLTRLMAPESRPVEACWWTVLADESVQTLIIGLGADDTSAGGALRFAWQGGHLQRRDVPDLPLTAGAAYRHVVRDRHLEAHPLPDKDGRASLAPYWRLTGGRWTQATTPL